LKSRRIYLFILDAILINISALLALYLRFEGKIPVDQLNSYQKAAPWFTALSLVAFALFGLYSVILRYASIDELLACAVSSAVSAGILGIVTRTLLKVGYSRAAIIITGVIEFILLGGMRVSVRLAIRIFNKFSAALDNGNVIRVLVVGAGDAGAILGREMLKPTHPRRKLVGYIDDDPAKKGATICGVKVLGGREMIPSLIKKLDVNEVIIAMPSAPRKTVRHVVELCQDLGVRIRTLPRLLDMAKRPFRMDMVRDIDVEDLLGRPEAKLDMESIRSFLKGKRVLVTGAGGSIGSEICRQVARFEPEVIILLGHGENSIFEAKMDLDHEFPNTKKETIIADVRDSARIRDVFAVYTPQIVFHAAAHKHVPLMEENIIEAVKVNIFGTLNVARASLIYEAEKFVMISTDKAVNPTSVMGATKRVAEMIVQSMNAAKSKTSFVSVRFGNVLGSRGSVVPVFKKQIARGGPVTVTHPDMKRYFMTVREAVQLVLQAATMGKGGEIFVLDMGEPVRIVELAEQMIKLSGYTPYEEIPIVFTGIRPGEKISEELLTAEEGTTATHHSQIFIAKQKPFSLKEFQEKLRTLESLVFPSEFSCRVFDFARSSGKGQNLGPSKKDDVHEKSQDMSKELKKTWAEVAVTGMSGSQTPAYANCHTDRGEDNGNNVSSVNMFGETNKFWASDKDAFILLSRKDEIVKTLKELVPSYAGQKTSDNLPSGCSHY